jgi:hypothetical protein
MSGLFDSLGLSLAFAGGVILLAGLFLTPIGGVLINAVRSRREVEVPLPLPVAPVQPAPTVQPVITPAPALAAREQQPADGAREQEALFARALVTAQKTAEDLVARAKADAQNIVANAQASANEIVGTARRNAAEVIQKAEQQAETIVAKANEKAAARLVKLQTEIQRLVVDAHQVFQGAQRVVHQNVVSASSRLDLLAAQAESAPEEENGDEASTAGPAEQPVSRTDGNGTMRQVHPSGDGRPAIAVTVDGTGATERKTARFP